MNIAQVIKKAVEDETFAKELYNAASSAAGKDPGSEEHKNLLSYFTLDEASAKTMTPAFGNALGGFTTTTTTTTFTTAACTTTGTTTTTTGN